MLSSSDGDLTDKQLHNILCGFSCYLGENYNSFKEGLKDTLTDEGKKKGLPENAMNSYMNGFEKGCQYTCEQWKKKLWDDFDKYCSGKNKCNKKSVKKFLDKCEKKWNGGKSLVKKEWQSHFGKYRKSLTK